MDLIISALSYLFFLLALKLWLYYKRTQHIKLPPKPPSLPIIGHLHLFKQPLHRTLLNLSQNYGSIFYLQCGSYPMVIISSPSAVEECFTKNDIVLANRPPLVMGKYLNYNHTTLVTAPYGDHWRNLRRISAIEIFSSNRLNAFLSIRREEMKDFLKKLNQICGNGYGKVEIRPLLSELTFNIIMRMVTGEKYSGEARKFRELIKEIFIYAEASYPGDFLPILQWVDVQGHLKKVKALAKTSDELLQGLIDRQRNDQKDSNNSMISHLLSLQKSQPEYYTDETIKGFILDIIFGGTESSALTIEWAMSSLLNNPQVLEKAQNELDTKISQENLIDESDVSNLPYLENILSETLRLYPVGPLLLPHLSSKDCKIGEYDVPKNSIVLVNAWAIHRSPELWDDAEKFVPERFEGSESTKAYSYKYLPFGHGRRVCPGMGLATRVVGFALGSMIQCFEWKRIDSQEIDMTEGVGLSMPKAKPLEALCKARDTMKAGLFLTSN